MSCRHRTIDDFRVPGHEHRYVCSRCEQEFNWVDGESCYYGTLECRKCCLAAVEAVVCSAACGRAYDREKAAKRGPARADAVRMMDWGQGWAD